MTTTEAPMSIPDLERALEEARVELTIAEAAEIAASEAVSRAREEHALGRILRSAWLTLARKLASDQEAVETIKARIRGLDRELLAAREAEALERARASGAALAGWQDEAAALETWTADLIVGTIAGFERIDAAFRELHERSGGKLGSRTKGPAAMLRVHGALVASLHELSRYYSNTTTNGG